MPAPNQILIYAELLSNIRQVTVACSLPTPSSSGTKAIISTDGQQLLVVHDGARQSLTMPERVSAPSMLPIPQPGTTNLAWRLPLGTATTARPALTPEAATPWSAQDVQPGSGVRCGACDATIVATDVLREWKNLPSENWAEMMEFWHCHKPQIRKHDDGEGHLQSRGYGATSRIAAQSAVGFVDLTSFMLSDTDIVQSSITGDIVESSTASRNLVPENIMHKGRASDAVPIRCSACNHQLGVQNQEMASVSLFKWEVAITERSQQLAPSRPTLPQCFSAMLLATMARSGSSKSVIIPMKTQAQQTARRSPDQALLNIWLFNGNITFSSTSESGSPLGAVKVFYRMVSQVDANEMLDSMTSNVQDILLPPGTIEVVKDKLRVSSHCMPQSDRKFKEWSIGLLERWVSEG
ncbi:ubiquitin-conjugating enzyme E2C-binding protein [Xylariaceae sp. FL0016]|nr:ubiquitin-conjugating enzyme E2C-binding protein [Xylariaceae sp. FL0016]